MSRFLPLVLIAAGTLAGCSAPETRPTVASQSVVNPPVVTAPVVPAVAHSALLARLQRLAPDADPGVLALALEARACAARSGNAAESPRLAVIDYTLPSTRKRLWVFDLDRDALLYSEHVAHGRGSGENYATSFSNRDESHQTSLGLFTTNETYVGGNGYSLRMDGLEPGINSNARQRLIVMHGAPYVDASISKGLGRLGRSHGCPAVREPVARELIDRIKGGTLVFAYYPDAAWLQSSAFLNSCGTTAAHR